MSEPEVRDITFDRPDYTSGAFIVFTGQTSDVAPPGEFWAKRGFQKILTGGAFAHPGASSLVIYYGVGAGKTLFVTDIMVRALGWYSNFGSRYPVTGYWYVPIVPDRHAVIEIYKGGTLIDAIRVTPYSPLSHKNYRTPLVFYSGEVLRIEASAEVGTADVFVMVTGYETIE
jgi:hypothetical protein